jgi:hypothetical protein
MAKDPKLRSASSDIRPKAEANLSQITEGIYRSVTEESRSTGIGDGRRFVVPSRVFVAVILDSVRFI